VPRPPLVPYTTLFRSVAELLAYPLIRIHRMRGVGNKTRQELADLVHQLRRRFPLNRPSDEESLRLAAENEIVLPAEIASVDLLRSEEHTSELQSRENL